MANTYTQIYVQIVFAVKFRQNLVSENFRDDLEKYICGIVKNEKSKPLAIYCNPDHTHILIGLHPTVSISDMAKKIKANSSKWINERNFVNGQFRWQVGFGAFTYSHSALDNVIKYINNQHEHHRKTSFKEEYLKYLEDFKVDYKNLYLFDWD